MASMLVALGDLYAGSCSVCGSRGDWGVASQTGPKGCIEAVRSGQVFCAKHIPEKVTVVVGQSSAAAMAQAIRKAKA